MWRAAASRLPLRSQSPAPSTAACTLRHIRLFCPPPPQPRPGPEARLVGVEALKRRLRDDVVGYGELLDARTRGEAETLARAMDDAGVYRDKAYLHPDKDNDAIIDRIQKSTRGLKQGPVGHTLSSAEKRKFLINTLLDLEDSKEAVYSTLDAWIAFEQDFPLASLKQAIVALQKEEQWHRIVQVIKWMLSKGQGNTIRTYEQLVRALEKENRAEEAHKIWEKKIAHDLHSVPWRFCGLMLAIYYRNNMLDRLIKLFHTLEACGRKCPSKEYVRKVEVAYEMLGLLEEQNGLLEKYKDLYNKPSDSDRKKSRQFKKAEKKSAELGHGTMRGNI